jgi:hypothetical protein
MKLKSSPKQKLWARILSDLLNWNLTSSAYLLFKNKSVSSVGLIWMEKHVFDGCTAIDNI